MSKTIVPSGFTTDTAMNFTGTKGIVKPNTFRISKTTGNSLPLRALKSVKSIWLQSLVQKMHQLLADEVRRNPLLTFLLANIPGY